MTRPWRHSDSGSGPVLVLLHGIGMSHRAWDPVIPLLQTARRVIAFDIAGCGSTPPIPCGTPPTIGRLVDALGQSLATLGIDHPVDIAGNSLGGCMALEAARCGMARTAVAISPIGLWRGGPPLHVRPLFHLLRWMAIRSPRLLSAPMRIAVVRELALAVPLSVGSRRMPADAARSVVDDLARSTAFEELFESTRPPFDGRAIAVPVTVAFGRNDWILTGSARERQRLPPHARWVTKAGWGHVPMWADPEGVSALILNATC